MQTSITALFLVASILTRATSKMDATLTIICKYKHSDQICDLGALAPGQTTVITCTGGRPGTTLRLSFGETLLTDNTTSSVSATLHLDYATNGKEVQCRLMNSKGVLLESLSQAVRLVPHKTSHSTRLRTRREDNARSPLHISSNKVGLQRGLTYLLTCPVVQPGDRIEDIAWFKGSNCDVKKRWLILQHYNPPDGTLTNASTHYQFSEADYGMIIQSVDRTDSDRFWCKAFHTSGENYVEDFIDVTVLDTKFPKYEGANMIENITRLSLDFETINTIQCPIEPPLKEAEKVTVYWSTLTEDAQSLDIIVPWFSEDGAVNDVGSYTLGVDDSLSVNEFRRRDEIYCCHVFEKDADLRHGCVNVTWKAMSKQNRPFVSGCDVTTDSCGVELTASQDFLQLECSVADVYPRPTANWLVTEECLGEKTQHFISTCSDSSYNAASMTYNVTSTMYLHELPPIAFDCKFTCKTLGGAIGNGGSAADVEVSRVNPALPVPCHNCQYGYLFSLTTIFVILLSILIIGNILAFQKNQRFIAKHIFDFPTWKCAASDDEGKHTAPRIVGIDARKSENAHNADIEEADDNIDDKDENESIELDSLMNGDCKDNNESKVQECLVIRKTPDILVTDNTNNWTHEGELVPQSSVHDDVSSGFQTIRDVIATQDGGSIVIDAKGLHKFSSTYNHTFVDLYPILGDPEYNCVAYFETNKLILGLKWGKIVTFDTDKNEVTKFSSLTPVNDVDVHLVDITVDSQGFVFAGDLNGKAVSMFDPDGACMKRFEMNIEPVFLFAQVKNGASSLLVSSETTTKKYNIERGSMQPNKISARVQYTIDEESLDVNFYKVGAVTVQGNKLFLINKLQDGRSLQVMQHDASRGVNEHTFIIASSTGHKVERVVSISKDRFLVHSKNEVHVFQSARKCCGMGWI